MTLAPLATPVLHVGRFARVVHDTDGRVPTATHVVQTVDGRSVGYWRKYARGWSCTTLGPEWWQ